MPCQSEKSCIARAGIIPNLLPTFDVYKDTRLKLLDDNTSTVRAVGGGRSKIVPVVADYQKYNSEMLHGKGKESKLTIRPPGSQVFGGTRGSIVVDPIGECNALDFKAVRHIKLDLGNVKSVHHARRVVIAINRDKWAGFKSCDNSSCPSAPNGPILP